MTKAILKKWQRDALEVQHQLKHDLDENATLIKKHAKRVVILVDEILVMRENQYNQANI